MSNFIKEWTGKEIESLTRSFKRYSIFVFTLKFILPLTALAMIITLFVYPMLTNDGSKKIRLIAQEVKPTEVSTAAPIMTNPKFVGVDSKNQPYQIMAKTAVQDTKNEVVNLEEVLADITLLGDKWVSVIAKKGRYETAKGLVSLYGDVNVIITAADGETTQVTADDALVDIKNNTISSSNPVSVKSSGMDFKAQNFMLDKENQKISFQGGVKLIIMKQ